MLAFVKCYASFAWALVLSWLAFCMSHIFYTFGLFLLEAKHGQAGADPETWAGRPVLSSS